VTAVLSVIGYALVLGTFGGLIGVYPDLTESTVSLLSHLIAVVNTVALTALLLGVYYIKNGNYERHRIAMVSAFLLILFFLVIYLLKIGGGTEKSIIAPDLVTIVYLIMLAIHIVLSVVSVPVVLYVVLLGLTHSPTELAETRKAQVGRIAASAWILSLFLGIVTYLLLNHVYASEPRDALWLLALSPVAARELVAPSGLIERFGQSD
jgi:putative membrane protein